MSMTSCEEKMHMTPIKLNNNNFHLFSSSIPMNKKFIMWLIAISVLVVGGMITLISATDGGVSKESTVASDGRLTIAQNNRDL